MVRSQPIGYTLKLFFTMQSSGSLTIFFLHGFINLFSQHLDTAGSGNTEPHLSPTRGNNRDDNIFTDGDTFSRPACEYQHGDYLRKSSKLVCVIRAEDCSAA
jgi:hypothetical protein